MSKAELKSVFERTGLNVDDSDIDALFKEFPSGIDADCSDLLFLQCLNFRLSQTASILATILCATECWIWVFFLPFIDESEPMMHEWIVVVCPLTSDALAAKTGNTMVDLAPRFLDILALAALQVKMPAREKQDDTPMSLGPDFADEAGVHTLQTHSFVSNCKLLRLTTFLLVLLQCKNDIERHCSIALMHVFFHASTSEYSNRAMHPQVTPGEEKICTVEVLNGITDIEVEDLRISFKKARTSYATFRQSLCSMDTYAEVVYC